jgi:hypothetical protein
MANDPSYLPYSPQTTNAQTITPALLPANNVHTVRVTWVDLINNIRFRAVPLFIPAPPRLVQTRSNDRSGRLRHSEYQTRAWVWPSWRVLVCVGLVHHQVMFLCTGACKHSRMVPGHDPNSRSGARHRCANVSTISLETCHRVRTSFPL